MLDRWLGRFTMYRLVSLTLGVIALVAVALTAAGRLGDGVFGVGAMLLSLLVFVVASLGSNALIGRWVGAHPHLESSLITALLLWFLYWPSSEPSTLAWFAGAAVLANASKYVLAVRRRHLFNPAATGVVLLELLRWPTHLESIPSTSWWVASDVLLPVVVVGALLVLYRTRRLAVGLVFAVIAAGLIIGAQMSFGAQLTDAITLTFNAFPVVFFAGFMLSEPLTLPPRRNQQLVVAAIAGVLFAWPLAAQWIFGRAIVIGPFESTYEFTLVVTGALAFVLGQRAASLTLKERRALGADTFEYRFESASRLPFAPGQYLELHVPHRADARGERRMFSIASVPGDDVTVAIREPQKASSFKQALAALPAGARLGATSVHGDFVWPTSGPVLLVAGGIGITPFMSQLRAHQGRDVVLVYGVRDAEQAPYLDELEQIEGLELHLLVGDALTAEAIAAVVPDLADRVALVSGPPAMVAALRRGLRGRVRRVHTDVFLGY